MTGNQLDELFGQQKHPTPQALITINCLNYKMTDLAQLMERLLPPGERKGHAFEKLKDLKSAIDSAAIADK